MATIPTQRLFDRARLVCVADGLAIAVAVALPWSTSATGILAVLWVLALIPTLNWGDVRRDLMTPAGGLPVLLFVFGVLGMAWAGEPFVERLKGLDSFCKLLAIPLLLVQFRRSGCGVWVFGGYVASCTALLVISTLAQFVTGFSFIPMHWDHALVNNSATQSGELVTCIFGLLLLAIEGFERRRWLWVAGLLLVMLGMLANIFFVATGRTALVMIPVLLVVFAVKRLSAKGIVILFAGAILVGAVGWLSSPYLRDRTTQIWTDFQKYETTVERNSSGERIEFWKKSVAFVRQAPIFGHGTGSMPALFANTAAGKTGAAGSPTSNPHNQTFAVAIQLGLLGAVVLWAMWAAHVRLFRGGGLAEWIGLVVVVQNIVGSLFNSHLFDFNQGWVYVFGVGVAGGMVLKRRSGLAGREAEKQ